MGFPWSSLVLQRIIFASTLYLNKNGPPGETSTLMPQDVVNVFVATDTFHCTHCTHFLPPIRLSTMSHLTVNYVSVFFVESSLV
jgi:hypothetical protein